MDAVAVPDVPVVVTSVRVVRCTAVRRPCFVRNPTVWCAGWAMVGVKVVRRMRGRRRRRVMGGSQEEVVRYMIACGWGRSGWLCVAWWE